MTLTRDPAKQRAWRARSKGLDRGKGPNRVGRKAEREAGALIAFRAKVKGRTYCEGNATTCSGTPHQGHHAHHVRMRSQGGSHDPANGLLLCSEAHSFVHRWPEWSYANGFLRRSGGGSRA